MKVPSVRDQRRAQVNHSLATRGADFGDGSIYITYRNVRFSSNLSRTN